MYSTLRVNLSRMHCSTVSWIDLADSLRLAWLVVHFIVWSNRRACSSTCCEFTLPRLAFTMTLPRQPSLCQNPFEKHMIKSWSLTSTVTINNRCYSKPPTLKQGNKTAFLSSYYFIKRVSNWDIIMRSFRSSKFSTQCFNLWVKSATPTNLFSVSYTEASHTIIIQGYTQLTTIYSTFAYVFSILYFCEWGQRHTARPPSSLISQIKGSCKET